MESDQVWVETIQMVHLVFQPRFVQKQLIAPEIYHELEEYIAKASMKKS